MTQARSALRSLVCAAILSACAGAQPEPPPSHPENTPPPMASVAGQGPSGPPTPAEAQRFLASVEVDLRRLWVAMQRAGWVNENFVNDDTDLLSAQAQEASMEYLTRTIKASRRFD